VSKLLRGPIFFPRGLDSASRPKDVYALTPPLLRILVSPPRKAVAYSHSEARSAALPVCPFFQAMMPEACLHISSGRPFCYRFPKGLLDPFWPVPFLFLLLCISLCISLLREMALDRLAHSPISPCMVPGPASPTCIDPRIIFLFTSRFLILQLPGGDEPRLRFGPPSLALSLRPHLFSKNWSPEISFPNL